MAAVDNVEHQQQGVTIIRKRDRRHYGYQSVFGNLAGFYNLKNVPFSHTMYLSRTEYWTKHRRTFIEHTYPSFFMNIQLVPTHQWDCETAGESDEWTCE